MNKGAFDKQVGQRLRTLRLLKGMTQQELAAQLGISFQQVQKYERGANKLSFERAWRLSQLFAVPLAEWAEGSEFLAEEGGRQALHLLQAFQAIAGTERRGLLCALAQALAEPGADAQSSRLT